MSWAEGEELSVVYCCLLHHEDLRLLFCSLLFHLENLQVTVADVGLRLEDDGGKGATVVA